MSTASNSVSPSSNLPEPPQDLQATANRSGATLTWLRPLHDGGSPIVSFQVTVVGNPSNGCTTAKNTCTITGLTPGVPVSFFATTTTAAGTSIPTDFSAKVTPGPSVPSAPRTVSAVPGQANAAVSWTKSADTGGSPITGYRAYVDGDPSKFCLATKLLTCSIADLTDIGYRFVVVATNIVGSSLPSSPSNLATPSVRAPDAPGQVTGSSGDGAIIVAWQPPPATGGRPILSYRATSVQDPSKSCTTEVGLSCVVRGLTNNRAYSFTVRATNAVGQGPASKSSSAKPALAATFTSNHDGLSKIEHVVVIMQENRSFDNYFGTYPGANGIPMVNGVPIACVPSSAPGVCVSPFHSAKDREFGGPHGSGPSVADINGGLMNGFLIQAERGLNCLGPNDPYCTNVDPKDVMGWHDAREIANYWRYANEFVLQDNMFESIASWSLPAHHMMVSGWSANCSIVRDPNSCQSEIDLPANQGNQSEEVNKTAEWTDLTDLLFRHKVSWGYYVSEGSEPDCRNDESHCIPHIQNSSTPGIWNPLPRYRTVQDNNQLSNIQPHVNLLRQAENGTLPAVSWVVPDNYHSEHPTASIQAGQAYVTAVVNAIMSGPDWDTTAIFISWDDWGGFYDHVTPPSLDALGYGLRVPGLLISPYAKRGVVDHQILSHDAYLKFIEDVFLNGQRIDPATDGRPDSRPVVREAAPMLGDLANEFDFTQAPRRPLFLPTVPAPGPASQ
jgi:phospholipase C